MTKKFSQARKDAFLRALAQTGNQTISAERAKVSRSWVCLHRSSDAEFDAACRRAIAEAKARLRASPGEEQALPLPPPASGRGEGLAKWRGAKWKYHQGHELVVRGTGGSGGGKRVQIGRARLKQWTPRVEERFLSALAATCNVKAACAEVGMSVSSAYNHRKRWPAFARAWDEAVEIGFVRIEAALVEAGCNLFSEPEFEPDLAISGMTAMDALQLLHMHKHAVRGIGKAPGGPKIAVASNSEIIAALEKRLKSMDAWLKHGGREALGEEDKVSSGEQEDRRASALSGRPMKPSPGRGAWRAPARPTGMRRPRPRLPVR